EEGALTLLDLLERVPGVAGFRSGVFLQPAAAAVAGGTAGRLRVEIDGVVLDPLLAPSSDLTAIALAEVDSVVIERRLDALVVRLHTIEPHDPLPVSRVEAGTGEPNANLFRGLFMAPRFLFGPIAAAVERFDSDGAGRREPTDIFSGWLKWGWLSDAG